MSRLGGLKHSPPLHPTHLSGIAGRAKDSPLTENNKQDSGQKRHFGGKFSFTGLSSASDSPVALVSPFSPSFWSGDITGK